MFWEVRRASLEWQEVVVCWYWQVATVPVPYLVWGRSGAEGEWNVAVAWAWHREVAQKWAEEGW